MNFSKTIDLPTEQDSETVAAKIAACLTYPLILTFSGDIGAGKTTLIRAILKKMGVSSSIKSPTFSLIESYQTERLQIHHFDLYRIHDETELDYIGFRDFFSGTALCLIEWPERAPSYLHGEDVRFSLAVKGAGRTMQISALTSAGIAVLSHLQETL